MKDLIKERMRKDLATLSAENKELKQKLKQYSENGVQKLVNDTLKMKAEYESLTKEAIAYRDEWEQLVKEQKSLMNDYKNLE